MAQGHIRDAKGVVPENSWQRCIQGADTISELLKVHSAALGFLRSPFLISYCAYIAATVHVRVAAQLGPLSPAFRRLQFCLEIFNETETVNTGVSRAKLGEHMFTSCGIPMSLHADIGYSCSHLIPYAKIECFP